MPGATYSFVVYCTLPYVSDETANPYGKTYAAPDSTGHVVSAWFYFTATGDDGNGGSTGWTISADAGVAKITPVTTVTATATGPTTATLSATIKTPDAAGITDATGSIEFYEGETATPSALLGSSAVGTAGTASLALTGLAAGSSHVFTARYIPGATDNYNASTLSTPVAYTAAKIATTTTLTASTPAVGGTTSDLRASVSAASGSLPAGSVQFVNTDTNSTFATVPVAAGAATTTVNGLAAGQSYHYAARFVPATSSGAYASSPLSAAVTVAVPATPAPSKADATVTVSVTSPTWGSGGTATISVSTGGGSVDVSIDGTAVGLSALSGGSATVAIPATLNAGTHSVTAVYSGDAATNGASGSAGFSVAQASSALSVSASDTHYGTASSVSVSGSAAGKAATGTATVAVDGGVIGTATLGSGSVALPALLSVGTHTVSVSYSGNGNVAGSTSSKTITVAKAVSKVTATISAKKAVVKKTKVKAKITVTVPGTSVVPTGTVQVKVGTKTVATYKLTAKSKGKLAVTLPKFTKVNAKTKVSVVYVGSSSVAKATSKTAVVKVTKK